MTRLTMHNVATVTRREHPLTSDYPAGRPFVVTVLTVTARDGATTTIELFSDATLKIEEAAA